MGNRDVTATLQGSANARHLPMVDFQLWPTSVSVVLRASPGSLEKFRERGESYLGNSIKINWRARDDSNVRPTV